MRASDFKLIRPLAMQDSILTGSNVAEADYAAYNAATTYAAGDRAILVDPSSAVTISIGTAATITWASHGQAVDTPVVFGTTGALPTGITAGVIYYIVSVLTNSFKISATKGGTPLNTSGSQSGTHTATAQVHKVYESLQAGNTGHYPSLAASSTWWIDAGSTNRWAMFDAAYNSQTTNTDTIVATLTPREIVNAIALLNLDAFSVTVSQTVSGYSSTITLASHVVDSWYDWFFEEPIRTTDMVLTDIPPIAAGVLTVTIDNTGGVAGCGVCIIGKSKIIGATLWEPSRTINDYSSTSEDTFGNVNLVKRSYSKRLNMEFYVTEGMESEVTRILEEFRATPMVFVGSESYAMTIIYGFLGAWEVPISISGSKPAHVEIKGLI